MKIILFILFMVGASWGIGQKYSFDDPHLNDEFENVYKYVNNPPPPTPFTKAQLQTLTPRRAGLLFFCTDCTTDGIVVSTGSTVGGVGRISARTTAIN